MDTSSIIIIILLILLFFTFASHLVIIHSNPQPVPVPVPIRFPQPIGGCAGTRYGCCPDGRTPKMNTIGSNCYK